MEQALVPVQTLTYEGHAQKYEGGIDLWLARDLQHLLRCKAWQYSFGLS